MTKQIEGASDLYEAMLELKNKNNKSGFVFRKAQAKKAGIDWTFVEQSAAILGLTIVKSGSGYLIANH